MLPVFSVLGAVLVGAGEPQVGAVAAIMVGGLVELVWTSQSGLAVIQRTDGRVAGCGRRGHAVLGAPVAMMP